MSSINSNRVNYNNILTQSQRNMLYRYNVFFTITFKEINNGVVYYLIKFGLGDNSMNDNMPVEYYEMNIRYSELRKLKINLNNFPSRTLFNYTSEQFIKQRLNDFKIWIISTLEDGHGIKLFNKLRDIYNQNNNHLPVL